MENTKYKQLLKNLESRNKAEVITSIDMLRKEGNESAIPFLVSTLVNNPDEGVKNAVSALLFDLKEEKALPALIIAIIDPVNKEYQQLLVSACWESGLNCRPYLKFFAELAIISDYFVAIECLTVIENMVGPFDEKELEAAITMVKEGADNDEEKFDLLNSIWEVLVDFKAIDEEIPEN